MARARVGLGVSFLRLRSDEQLVSLFRAGNEDAFRVIHDRYRARMHAYARQMLSSTAADAEDVVQEIFVRAYSGLRANRRDLALRAWLYRIAHNRCIDELRRPQAIAVEAVDELGESPHGDPHLRAEQREALRRLIADVQRLPEQQRSALLMRELGGMPYADLSGALGVSVPAVKSLLVRARVGLVQADEARDTDCAAIREDLIVAHDRGVRASGRARRHMRDCSQCRQFRREVHGSRRRFALLLPALGPVAAMGKLLGIGTLGGGSAAAGSSTGAAAGSGAVAAGSGAAVAGSSAAAGSSAVASASGAAAGSTAVLAGGGAAVAGGSAVVAGGAVAAGGGAVIGGGALAAAGAGHVATLLAATVVAAGSAIGIQQVAAAPHHHAAQRPGSTSAHPGSSPASTGATAVASVTPLAAGAGASKAAGSPTAPTSTAGGRSGHAPQQGAARVTLRPTGPGYVAGTGSTSTSTGSSGTTTSTTTGTATTTTPIGTGTTGTTTTSGTPITSGPTTSGSTTTGAPTTTTPVSGDPTSTATSTDPTGSAAPTSTTPSPVTSAPTSTSAATTAAHPGRSSGGSTLLPTIKRIRSGGGSLRDRHGHRARLVRAGLLGG